MKRYDPDTAPDPVEWLALDEQVRIDLAERYHRAARIKLPNVALHALFHSIVENQIADGLEPVLRAMKRLTDEGLSRHDAIHAVASVVADHLWEAMHTKDETFASAVQTQYNAAIERLTVKEWHRKHGQ
jgi:hypothetical protein